MTRELVKYYVCYRLGRAGYEDFSSSGQQQIITTTDSSSIQNSISVKRTLKLMGDEFSNAYFGAFDDMTNTINVHGEDLKEVLYKIYDVTCGTGIEWGRLVGLFVFSSLLAIKAMACHRPDVVENIIQWTADYLEQERFSEWINQHGGWDGFVQFYKTPKLRNQDLQQQFWLQAYNVSVNVFTKMASVANLFLN